MFLNGFNANRSLSPEIINLALPSIANSNM
jgi:hypothetical protein